MRALNNKALLLVAYLSGLTAAQNSAVTLPLIKEQEEHLKAYIIKANQCADEAARKAELTERARVEMETARDSA
jgi:Tfp pilus assembly protein PilN